jgi:threonine dehydratase
VYVTKNRADAEAKLRDIVENTGVQMVHPFNDPLVIAGQGTVMMELLEQAGDLDAVLAPVGGGGLLSGLCLVGQACRPNMKIYACEPAGALDAIESVRQNRVVPMEDPRTMAEGLRTSLGDGTLPILRKCLEGFFVVQEEEIVEAMTFAYERLKLVIEPSSAVALVPLLRKEPVLAGRTVGVVLSGGNVDLASFWRDLKAHALPATPS